MTRKKPGTWKYQEELGERIRQVRTDRGRTLSDVARIADMTSQVLSRYEGGEVMPSAYAVMRLAKTLDVSPGWLLRGPKENGKKDGRHGTGNR